ncbi:MAG: hypothetical protein IJ087_06875 [Eggerthellaceae bacterium]|nr:hypothetical protein [Eggerthellaceae bacterium]
MCGAADGVVCSAKKGEALTGAKAGKRMYSAKATFVAASVETKGGLTDEQWKAVVEAAYAERLNPSGFHAQINRGIG